MKKTSIAENGEMLSGEDKIRRPWNLFWPDAPAAQFSV